MTLKTHYSAPGQAVTACGRELHAIVGASEAEVLWSRRNGLILVVQLWQFVTCKSCRRRLQKRGRR